LLCALSLTSGCKRSNAGEKRLAPPILNALPPEKLEKDPFKVRADAFADVRVLRYRVAGFEQLTLPQKRLLYYLQQAALSGRDITYDQNFAHNLAVRRTLEAVLQHYQGDRNAPHFQGLLNYAKRVWFSNGIHHHYSTRKFLPEGISAERFAELVSTIDRTKLPLAPGETPERLIKKLTPIIFDPEVAAKRVENDPSRDPVRDSANHFYVNLTKDEVLRYMQKLAKPNDPQPPSYGLNSQLVRTEHGAIEERVWKVSGMYGSALAECVRWLEQALDVAENDAQRAWLEKLIAFYKSGDLRDWDAYSVAWVADTESKIDLIHGFIETYGDPLDMRATYEAIVQLEDPDATARIRTLSANAQWFEDHAPIADEYKKKSVVGVSARVIQVVLGAGDTAPPMPSGVNLPNASWIRQQHGSKSITLGNILAAYEADGRDSGIVEEFAASTREVARAKAYGAMAQALLVDMHEVIGHASGQLAPNVAPHSETLQGYASALEEGRADLVALYYMLDPKLVEYKLVPSLEVGRAAYDSFVRGALLVQLARVPLGEKLEEAHMRNRALIARWALKEGANDQVIERVERGGKTYFVVRDYVKLRKLFGRLLREIQRIKSEGDFEAGKKLVEEYGVSIEPALHKEVRARYEVLGMQPYAGFLQPRLVPVEADGSITDVQIEYPEDFVAQQLEYSARYSFLPTYN
jgi:dipeptidyl-peptidase III